MKSINTIDVHSNKDDIEVRIGFKTYYVCNACGRLSFKKLKWNRKVWCKKHYKQARKYGDAIDNNPRHVYDKNQIDIYYDKAIIHLYSQLNNEKIGEAIIDKEFVNIVRYSKWKIGKYGEITQNNRNPKTNKSLKYMILRHVNEGRAEGYKYDIENKKIINKNGDKKDCRLENLSCE